MSSRLLCDVGNTNFSFSDGTKISEQQFDISSLEETVYFIAVNPYWERRLDAEENWVNLRQFVNFERYYTTMGIDRIMACEAVDNALIVDAGSAITVDRVKDGLFEGGYIYPGFAALEKCFKNISTRLEVSIDFDIDLATMPKNTNDALSFGAISPLLASIRELSQDLPVILTGGDATQLHKLLPHAQIDETLVFKGMQKLLDKEH